MVGISPVPLCQLGTTKYELKNFFISPGITDPEIFGPEEYLH